MPNLNINIPDSDETTKGIIEISTQVEVDAGTDDTKAITPDKLANSDLASDVATNNAKTTNATHTGEVTGSGALTVDKTAISNKTLVTAVAGDHVLIGDGSDSDNLKKVNVSDFLGGGGSTVSVQYFNTGNSNVNDSTTYYIGNMTVTSSGVTSFARIPIPAGTLLSVHVNTWVTSTTATELATLKYISDDGAESLTLATDIALNARNTNRNFTGLSHSVSQGNSYIQLETPVYATNPSNLQIRVTAIIEI
jgi:hypothetical protein